MRALTWMAALTLTTVATGALAHSQEQPKAAPKHKRVVVLGIDGMDPDLLLETVRKYPRFMPNFKRLLAKQGAYSLGTSVPPQSPVAWSNFITGRNPGGHGIFDFIHRDPVTRGPAPSTVEHVEAKSVSLWGQWQFPLTPEAGSNRTGKAFWTILMENGIPASLWRMPIDFPVEPSDGVSLPGMGTPALDSAYGQFTMYTSNPPLDTSSLGGRIVPVRSFEGRIDTSILGPANPFKKGDPQEVASLVIRIDETENLCAIDTGRDVVLLEPGQWSGFTHVDFDLLPMGAMGMTGTVRFYLRGISPHFELYASPVNIDPESPAAPVSYPDDASADLAQAIGIYYTQGMAEEVNGLKEKIITDEEFLAQAGLIYDQRVRMMDYALDKYLGVDDGVDEGGLFFFYYSTVDLCCHMMWNRSDPEHPQYDPEFSKKSTEKFTKRKGSTFNEIVDDLYIRMDPVLGRLRERVGEETLIIVMSDHGFAPYHWKFNLNTWLVEEGYLVLKEGQVPEVGYEDPSYKAVNIFDPTVVDWSKTRAYGMGFNGLYLNLAGRELDNPATEDQDESGIVKPGAEADALVAELVQKLEALTIEVRPGDVQHPVLRCDVTAVCYDGDRVAEAPDIQVGYNSAWGNSDPASTGRIPQGIWAPNLGGTFNGSHLMAPEAVPGLLLTNGTLAEGDHALEDLTVEILRQYGLKPAEGMHGHPVLQ